MVVKSNLITRAAARYLRDFPVQHGKGHVNRLLGRFLTVTIWGDLKIRLINPLEYHQRVLLYGEPYETELIEFLTRILQPGMVVCDVGANLGLFSLLASKC